MNPKTAAAIASLLQHGYECKPDEPYEGGVNGFVTELKELFARYFDPAEVEREFALPEKYLDFLQTVEGSYYKRNWAAVYAMEDVYSVTQYELKLWEPGSENPVFWINIGHWSDKHQLLMCVSKSHKHFGKVVEGYDDHPYCSESFRPYQKWKGIQAYAKDPE